MDNTAAAGSLLIRQITVCTKVQRIIGNEDTKAVKNQPRRVSTCLGHGGRSSVEECWLVTSEVAGSFPVAPANGSIAQLG